MDAIRNWDSDWHNRWIAERRYWNSVISVEIVTDVTAEPLTLAEAKRHLRVDFTDDDVYIAYLIKESREQLEDELKLSFAPKTLKVELRNELGYMALPYGPVTTIDEVTDFEGTILTTGQYEINNGVLETSYDTTVFVEYTAGFELLPHKYLRMLKERVAYNYHNRGDEQKNLNAGSWLL
jgi:hypothetical protein